MKNSTNFTEKEILNVLDFALSINNTEAKKNFNGIKSAEYLKYKNIPTYFISIILSNCSVDKNYMFTLIKKNPNCSFHNTKQLIEFYNIFSIVYTNNQENENILNYLIIVSDMLLYANTKNLIQDEEYARIKNQIEKIKSEISKKRETREIDHSSRLQTALKFCNSLSRGDFLIESLKI